MSGLDRSDFNSAIGRRSGSRGKSSHIHVSRFSRFRGPLAPLKIYRNAGRRTGITVVRMSKRNKQTYLFAQRRADYIERDERARFDYYYY